MPQPKNAMEIFKLLDTSNCRECGEKTCLAFAGAVFSGSRKLQECPKLDRETIIRFSPESENENSAERNRDAYLQQLKKEYPAAIWGRATAKESEHSSRVAG